MGRGMLWTSVMCLLGIVAGAHAQSAEVQFQTRYGDEAAKAAKSPAGKAGIAFAAKLLSDAGNLKDDPTMARLLLEKAYELGSKSAEGCATAVQAARICMEQETVNKQPWQEKLVTACRIQYQKSSNPEKSQAGDTLICELMNVADTLSEAGNYAEALKTIQECRQVAATIKSPRIDDITDRLKSLNGKLDLEKKFSSYAKKLVDNPQDAVTAKAAVLLCIVQLDNPAKAVAYAEATGDDELKKFVPLAAQDLEKQSGNDCMILAAWYQALAKKADRTNKFALLTRTKKYYQKFVGQHSDDTQGIKARKELDEILKELAQLSLGGRELVLNLGKGVKMKLVRISAGQFTMGGDDFRRHPVMLTQPFYIGATEITQAQYEQVTGQNPSYFKGAQLPVDMVSWDDSVEFCKKLSTKSGYAVKLPTEAQWEYACRAGSKAKYCFGDDPKLLDEYAWYEDNSDKKMHPAAQKKPNAWGLYDMHGNVCEWCSDWYDEKYYNSAKTDPTGPESGSRRILRGGGWLEHYPRDFYSATRGRSDPSITNMNNGFRVVVELR